MCHSLTFQHIGSRGEGYSAAGGGQGGCSMRLGRRKHRATATDSPGAPCLHPPCGVGVPGANVWPPTARPPSGRGCGIPSHPPLRPPTLQATRRQCGGAGSWPGTPAVRASASDGALLRRRGPRRPVAPLPPWLGSREQQPPPGGLDRSAQCGQPEQPVLPGLVSPSTAVPVVRTAPGRGRAPPAQRGLCDAAHTAGR